MDRGRFREAFEEILRRVIVPFGWCGINFRGSGSPIEALEPDRIKDLPVTASKHNLSASLNVLMVSGSE